MRTTQVKREPCGQCHAMVEVGAFHPYSFCVLVKAGLDPWQEVRKIAGQLRLGDPGEQPPKVWEIHP
jgi:hypothetical protein